MKWKVLVSNVHIQPHLDTYRDLFKHNNIEFDVVTPVQFVSEAELLEIIGPYHAIVCGDDEVTDKVLERAKNLKVISKWGVGIDSIDLESAKRHGVAVYNSPGAFSESCALMVFSFLMHFSRGANKLDQAIRSGEWRHQSGFTLSGKTMGIIGIGNVGRAVAKCAKAFDLQVLGNDIKEIDLKVVSLLGIKMVEKNEIFRNSDFLVLATDLNPTSKHLLSTKELSLMKPTSFVFNISRGSVIDESALISTLKENRIAGAGLDVFEVEPLPQDSPLRAMENVILTPHNAYNTIEAKNYVHDNTVKNLIDGLNKAVLDN